MAETPDLKYRSDVMSSGQIIIVNPEAALFQEKIKQACKPAKQSS
jgi:hypothetical protein